MADAQVGKLNQDDDYYLRPGALWWSFDGNSALDLVGMLHSNPLDPRTSPGSASSGCVLLLDEIDKAEPDLPNDLLEPLDTLTVTAPGGRRIKADRERLIVIVTSNGERRLPPAFLRRCLHLELRDLMRSN